MATVSPTDEQRAAIGNISESLPLTAGAGSGKTFVLTHRYFQILAEQDADLDEILTITFTDKAATQMKQKIRNLLSRYAQQEIPEEFPPICKESFQNPEHQVWQELLDKFQQSYISTFHGFCARLLREVATEVGLDPEFAVMDEQTTALRRPEILRRTIFQLIEADDESIAMWLQYFSVYQILEKFGGMLKNRSRYEKLADYYIGKDQANPKSVDILLTDIQNRYEKEVEPVVSGLSQHPVWREISATLQSLVPQDPADNFYEHYQALKMSQEILVTESTVLEKVNTWLTIEENLKSKGKKGNWEGVDFTDFKKQMLSFREDILSPALKGLAIFDESIERIAIQLAQAGTKIYETVLGQYQDWKQQHNYYDYDDLLFETVRVLNNYPDIRRNYNQQFEHILVDEFQDTNPIQYDLVNLLRLDSEENEAAKLFVVGDPKQSIYRFRGTEVRLFNKAKKELSGADHPLQLSFRSQPALLEWFDVCFSRIMGTEESAKTSLEEFEQYYLPLQANRENLQPDRPHVSIQIVEIKSEDDEDTIENRIQVEAAHIAEYLQSGLTEISVEANSGETRSARFGDVALLFRKTTHLKQYEYALQLAGIPYYTVGGKGFYSKQEILDLITVLRAFVQPEDNITIAGVLRSALFGLSDEGLFWLSDSVSNNFNWSNFLYDSQLMVPKNLSESDQIALKMAREKIQRWRTIKDRISVGQLVEMICTETGYFGILGASKDGAQKVRNVEQFIEMAYQFSQTIGASAYGFVQYLHTLEQESESEEAEVYAGEYNAVQLMTIHKSKGLEFPVVIVPNIDSGGNNKIQKDFYPEIGWALSWDNLEFSGDDQKMRTIAYYQIQDIEKKQSLAESKRLFYVASTRAKDHLMLSGIVKGDDAVNKVLNKDAETKDDWMVWTLGVLNNLGWNPGQSKVDLNNSTIEILHHDYVNVDSLPGAAEIIGEPTSSEDQLESETSTVTLSLEEIQRRWKVDSPQIVLEEVTPSMISDFATSEERFRENHLLGFPDLQQLYRPKDGLAGPQFGVLAHAVVERWLETRPESPDALIQERVQHSIFRDSREAITLLKAMIDRFGNSSLFRMIEGKSIQTEVPFLTKISGRPLTGNIDLVIENNEHSYSIIDLKSDTINDNDDLEKKKETYRFQLLAYAYALKTARGSLPDLLGLYFLRTGDLVEIECNQTTISEMEQIVGQLIEFAKPNSN